MLCGIVFDRFATNSPVTVMLRGLLERALAAPDLDQLFAATAQRQYTRELLFSTAVDLMAAVACRIYPALNAAYQAEKERVGVSVKALYDKFARSEPCLGESVVRHTAGKLKPLLRRMRATMPPLVSGYATKILDGNHLGASQRRLKELRDVAAGPLPGQTLVVLEPEYQLASDVICCEDGHAQERSLLDRVLDRVAAQDLWIADRNFCTTGFLFGLMRRKAGFIIRQHGSTLQWQRESERRRVGRIKEGMVYEQTLWLQDGSGKERAVRRVSLVLDKPTRDGDSEIHVLTNLPAKVGAKRVAQLYRERWTIEHLFLNLTTILHCEMNTLPYPKAALFGFCVALAAGNVLATIKGTLRAVHGIDKVETEVSDYHVALEIRGKYQGMMVALPTEEWQAVGQMSEAGFAKWLLGLGQRVNLARFRKARRGPKKPRERRRRFSKAKHIATARLLAEERRRK
jgi:Transposase DDE domain